MNVVIDRRKSVLVLESLMKSQCWDLPSEMVLSLLLKPSLWCLWVKKKIGWKSMTPFKVFFLWDLLIIRKQGWISTAAVMAIDNFGFIHHFYKSKILSSEDNTTLDFPYKSSHRWQKNYYEMPIKKNVYSQFNFFFIFLMLFT